MVRTAMVIEPGRNTLHHVASIFSANPVLAGETRMKTIDEYENCFSDSLSWKKH